jgi:hypothetical protein
MAVGQAHLMPSKEPQYGPSRDEEDQRARSPSGVTHRAHFDLLNPNSPPLRELHAMVLSVLSRREPASQDDDVSFDGFGLHCVFHVPFRCDRTGKDQTLVRCTTQCWA